MNIEGLYNIEYYNHYGSCIILLFCRDSQNKKRVKIIRNFHPYIYVSKNEFENIKEQIFTAFPQHIINIEEVKNKKLLMEPDKSLIKLTLKSPSKIFDLSYFLKEIYESDISITTKFLIDNVDNIKSVKYRILYLDIETTSEFGFPDYTRPYEKIISICAYDNYQDKTFLWIWHNKYNEEFFSKNSEYGIININRFKDEISMINSFINFIQEIEPDYITAWYISFDINYLIARCQYIHIDVDKFSPLYNIRNSNKWNKLELVKWSSGTGIVGKRAQRNNTARYVSIVGIQCFDLLQGYKNIIAHEQPSWSLNFIAEKELNLSKLQTHFNIGSKWLEQPEFIEDYNFMDVILIKLIDEKLNIINYYDEIKNVSLLGNINDVFSSGKVLDSYMLKKYKNKFIFPSKSYNVNINKEMPNSVSGGFVKQPIAGIYKNVIVLDYSAFYPSIMKTFNLSSDVLINFEILKITPMAEEVDNINNFENIMHSYNSINNFITYKIRTNKFSANITVDMNKKGVMTNIVDGLINLRKQVKKEMLKYEFNSLEYNQLYKTQFSYKFLINATYGVNAYPGFRLFNPVIANTITAFARMASKYIGSKLREKGFNWIYSDTDSLFFVLNTNSLIDNLTEIENIKNFINSEINNFVNLFLPPQFAVNHNLRLDIEKIYSSLLLLDVKKRYFGRLKYLDGKNVNDIHYMGLDLKKSSTSIIARDIQYELCLTLLNSSDIYSTLSNAYNKVTSCFDINSFKLPSKLNKNASDYKVNSPTLRGVAWSNSNLSTHFKNGDKFYIIYVIPSSKIKTDVIAFENLEQLSHITFQIDKHKYLLDVYRKINNVIRGIPKLKYLNDGLYIRTKSHSRNLSDFFN